MSFVNFENKRSTFTVLLLLLFLRVVSVFLFRGGDVMWLDRVCESFHQKGGDRSSSDSHFNRPGDETRECTGTSSFMCTSQACGLHSVIQSWPVAGLSAAHILSSLSHKTLFSCWTNSSSRSTLEYVTPSYIWCKGDQWVSWKPEGKDCGLWVPTCPCNMSE